MTLNIRKPLIKSENRRVANLITLITACCANCLDILGLSAVNVAVPAIAADLNLDTSTLPWLIASYSIAFAAFLLPAGKLGDLYGYRLVYLAGMLLYVVASIVNAVAPNEYVLFVFRAIQGLGAACTVPNGIALIANSYEDENARRIALSAFGGSGPIGFVVGLIVGGVLTFTVGWRWIFYISAISSFAMFFLALLYVPDFRHDGSAESVDMLGFFLVTSGFILVIYALSDGQWHLARDPVTLVIGVLLIAAFMAWQFKATYPLLRPSWWRRPNFAGAFWIGFFNYASFMGYIYVTTLLFQDAFGYTALQTALYYLPMGIVAFFSANLVGFITPYTGYRSILIFGAVLALGGNIGSLYYSVEMGFWKLIFPMHLIMGLGQPMPYVGGQNAIVATAPPSETGTLGAVYNTASQLGAAFGMAILTAVINGVNPSGATGADSIPGYHAAYYANIAFLSMAILIGIFFIKGNADATSVSEERTDIDSKSNNTLQDLEKGKEETIITPTKEAVNSANAEANMLL
ncbi:major facilitator superfamily domain-containing protein [Umbelopsis sp. AD052]|nr:major facilitator superfamily domain-containing protein [Umbelopsis sp. AD052]